jgi:hypothetical protein
MQNKILYILSATLVVIASLLFTSCTQEDIFVQSTGSKIQVIGQIPNFDPHYVNTKSTKNSEENAINNMTLLIFDVNGNMEDIQKTEGSAAVFIVDKETLDGTETMYLLANVKHLFVDWNKSTIKTLDDLKAIIQVTGNSLGIPSGGFPMVGITSLSQDILDSEKVRINLELLYAKVDFSISLIADQVNPNKPNFVITSCRVYNIPQGVKLIDNSADPNSESAFTNQVLEESIPIRLTGNTQLTHLGNAYNFSFYMPEHKIKGKSSISYPDGIKTDQKQRYKPLFVEDEESESGFYENKKPTYVLISGEYTDHHEIKHYVSYKVYLGKNAIDDFYITRNGHYINTITIRGITNHSDTKEGSVSLDHRVETSSNDFAVYMERESLLDSHIEVRPVHINIHPKEGVNQSVQVYLSSPNNATPQPLGINDSKWVRMEVTNNTMYSDANKDKYCPEDDETNKGKRKFFTKDLLVELNASSNPNNGISTTLTDQSNTIWLYFDENINVSKSGGRNICLIVEYYEDNQIVNTNKYTFRQHDLYPAIYIDEESKTEYRYDIEYYEEYLYNYNSDDDYNATREGMAWGPKEGISNEIMAIQDVQNDWAKYLTYIEDAIKRAGGYYDFQNNFHGRVYTTKLINKMNQGVLPQNQLPESAAQHCHNKNKRNSDGTVNTLQWYLPAIGEIQHIMAAAYTDFEVFQENQYWSSQTSYRIGHFKYNLLWGIAGSVEGDYYYEDKDWARATSAVYVGNDNYSYEPSEITGISKTWTGSVTDQTGSFSTEVAPTSRDSGNQQRDELLRVRAVRNKYKRTIGSTDWIEITNEQE